MREYTTFADFWPYYLREHSQPATRAWHYAGTSLAILTLIIIVLTQRWLFLPVAFICGYFFAWVSHGLIERNKPATFTYPLWSLGADFKMLFCFLSGKMKAELNRASVTSQEV